MIKPITKSDLKDCLKIFHQGYETVAIKFGLTEENCPDRGRACLPLQKLQADFENGALMFGYFCNEKLVGFLGIRMHDNCICKLNDIIILPEYRHNGYGKELLTFCKETAKALGAHKVLLGMIDDNKRLRQWYENNGFVNVGYKNYEGAPYTVGIMECIL